MTDVASNSIFPALPPVTLPATATVDTQSNAEESQSQLVESFDTFLQLLVTQIQNQDPTSPTDSDAFTQQLVQFSELEQPIQSNDNLETILSSIESQNAASVVSYIGQTVSAQGAATTLNNGTATFNLTANEFIPEAAITVRSSTGEIVFEGTQALDAGNNQFVWDGVTSSGDQLPDGGTFSITVTGENTAGNFSSISTAINGVVDGIDFSTSTPGLQIGEATIPLTAVTAVSATF
ncbi:MAG: flagellar hook capping FlgD N-terminal domain-containing protein [Hyphomicrobiales bacterium]